MLFLEKGCSKKSIKWLIRCMEIIQIGWVKLELHGSAYKFVYYLTTPNAHTTTFATYPLDVLKILIIFSPISGRYRVYSIDLMRSQLPRHIKFYDAMTWYASRKPSDILSCHLDDCYCIWFALALIWIRMYFRRDHIIALSLILGELNA